MMTKQLIEKPIMVSKDSYDRGIRCKGICTMCAKNGCYQYIVEHAPKEDIKSSDEKNISTEEQLFFEVIKSARMLDDYAWKGISESETIEALKLNIKNHATMINEIDSTNPIQLVNLKRLIIQNAADSFALLTLLDKTNITKKD